MTKLLGSDYYDEDYFDNPKTKKSNYGRLSGGYTEVVYRPFKKQQAAQIMKHLGYTGQLRPNSVLVVGCAKGFLVETIQRFGVTCEGIDISEYAIKESKKYTRACKIGNICDMSEYKDNQFEVVICLETLEHIPQPYLDSALNELSRVALRYIVISTPEGTDDENKSESELDEGGDPSHFSVHTPNYWKAEFINRRFILKRENVTEGNYLLIVKGI